MTDWDMDHVTQGGCICQMGWALVLTCPIGHMNTPKWNWKSPLSPRYMLGGRQNQDPQTRYIWTVLYFSHFQNPFVCVFDFRNFRTEL